jgi:hypothetical protein
MTNEGQKLSHENPPKSCEDCGGKLTSEYTDKYDPQTGVRVSRVLTSLSCTQGSFLFGTDGCYRRYFFCADGGWK